MTNMKKGKKNILICILVMALALPMVLPVFTGASRVEQAEGARILKLASCKALAIANSEKIEAYELQMEAKSAAKQSAIRSLQEKQRNMSTFRWTPLLNFKFPEKATEEQDYEFAYKPIQLQYEIDGIKHKIETEKIAESQKVSNIYIEIITSIAEITFLDQRIKALEEAIQKNKAKLAEGTATQAQIDQQEKKLEGYKNSITSERNKCQRNKEKLSKEVGFDVTVGYRFEDVFVSTSIARDNIEYLQNYALQRDQTVYEAEQDLELARLSLNTNYNLMKKKQGAQIWMISSYVTQALEGSKVNKRAFKKDYDKFLKKIDEPWQGSYKILFFKFPKEWFKGSIDGIRYVEDDPYVLYSATLEYESALKEYNNACNELKSAIEEGYDNLMETRKSYKTSVNELNSLRIQLIYDEVLNAMGQLSLEEYDTELGEYEKARSAVKDALSLYSKTLYEFDKTTCGGASAYFTQELIASKTGYAGLGSPEDYEGPGGGMSVMSPVIKKGATYSIRSILDSDEFMLYIDIPDDFDYDVTHFELWSDNRQIGEKTAKGSAIRHLRLTVKDVDSVFIRLYNGDEFIDDCSIDPEVSYGPLNVTVGYEVEDENSELIVGSYTVEDDADTDMIKLRFTFDPKGVSKNFNTDQVVSYYNISAERNLYLYSDEFVAADNPFSYMSFIKNDLGQLTVRMFSQDGEYIGGAYLNTVNQTLLADTEITVADLQDIAARQILTERKTGELQAELDQMKDLLAAAEELNSQEADSGTVSYYKKRIAELETEISEVSSNITSEQVKTLQNQESALVKQRAEQLQSEAITTEEEEEASEEEIKAKNTIINKAAKDFILKQKKDLLIESIQNVINADNREIAEINRNLKLLGDSDEDKQKKSEYEKRLEALEKEIEAAKKKLENAKSAELSAKDVTDEEVDRALRENGIEIYASCADQLSDALLYGTETGQWALAYLESQNLETSAENVRLVVSAAGEIKRYESMIARKDQLQKEYEEAAKKAESYQNKGGTSNTTLAGELDKIAVSYQKELRLLEEQIKRTDPAKEVKLKDYKKQKANLEQQKQGYEKEINDLLASKYTLLEYCKEVDEKLAVAKAKKAKLEKEKEDRKNELDDLLSNTESELEDRIKKAENELNAAQNNLGFLLLDKKYRNVYDDYIQKGKVPTIEEDRKLYYSIYPVNALVEKCKKALEDAKAKKKTFEETGTVTGLQASKQQIAAWQEELKNLDTKYSGLITKVNDEISAAKTKSDDAKKDWDASYSKKLDYEKSIDNIDEKIKKIDEILKGYY